MTVLIVLQCLRWDSYLFKIMIGKVNQPIRIDFKSPLSMHIVKMNIVLISFVKTVSPDRVLDVLIMMNAIRHIHVIMMQNALI